MKNIIDCQIFKPIRQFLLCASKAASQTYQLHTTYMLWFHNFILGLNSIFLLFQTSLSYITIAKNKGKKS